METTPGSHSVKARRLRALVALTAILVGAGATTATAHLGEEVFAGTVGVFRLVASVEERPGGEIDYSVLVTDAGSLQVVQGTVVTLTARTPRETLGPFTMPAQDGVAEFILRGTPGTWAIDLSVTGRFGSGAVSHPMSVRAIRGMGSTASSGGSSWVPLALLAAGVTATAAVALLLLLRRRPTGETSAADEFPLEEV